MSTLDPTMPLSDPLSDEQIARAVAFWCGQLRESETPPDAPTVARFAALLGVRLATATGRVTLNCDYEPKGLLADAAVAAGLDIGFMGSQRLFPRKTIVVVRGASPDDVLAKLGYGAGFQHVQPDGSLGDFVVPADA